MNKLIISGDYRFFTDDVRRYRTQEFKNGSGDIKCVVDFKDGNQWVIKSRTLSKELDEAFKTSSKKIEAIDDEIKASEDCKKEAWKKERDEGVTYFEGRIAGLKVAKEIITGKYFKE